jgi:hypothetical protein
MGAMRVERKRRVVQYESSSKLAAQEVLLKSEITDLRRGKTSLEDVRRSSAVELYL